MKNKNMKKKDKKMEGKNGILFGAIILVFVGAIIGGAFALPYEMNSGVDDAVAITMEGVDYPECLNVTQNPDFYLTQSQFNQLLEHPSTDINTNDTIVVNPNNNYHGVNHAILDGNYVEWTEAINRVYGGMYNHPAFVGLINANNFGTYVKMVKAYQNNDQTLGNQLATRLGITPSMNI